MKVLFKKDLKKVAKKGEILEVKDGYAENFLIKKGYAVKVTEKNMDNFILEKKEELEIHKQKVLDAENSKKDLEKLILQFVVKTGATDRVFGSVSQKQIHKELENQGYKIDKKQIKLINELNSLGMHNVEIELYKDIKAIIKVNLRK
ncbi:MAG: 50S ribosomal protein L9 [Bacilli bacterium]|nr:50S ribosomal protein L9 [Bacilli bacterium]